MRGAKRVAGVLAIVLAAACAREGDGAGPGASVDAALPAETPDIIGTVTRAEDARGGRVVLVEQIPERSAGYPKASVTVAPSTRVLRRDGQRTVPASAAELVVGTTVRAWFTGPVRESFPVQADARLVVIEPLPR